MIAVGIAVKELKYNLCSLWTLILFAMGSLLTYSGGVEYASRGAVSAAATELGITTAAQEWAHRTSFAAGGADKRAMARSWHLPADHGTELDPGIGSLGSCCIHGDVHTSRSEAVGLSRRDPLAGFGQRAQHLHVLVLPQYRQSPASMR